MLLAGAALVVGGPAWLALRGGGSSVGPNADAVTVARAAGLADGVPVAVADELIADMCASDGTTAGVQEAGRALGSVAELRVGGLRASIQALGAGAERRCPDLFSEEAGPALLDALQCFAVDAFVRSRADGPSSSPPASCRVPTAAT